MTETDLTERIIRRRMHGLYLTRPCGDILALARELLGLHSWFYRNVPFSALIRGADISGWKNSLTKTWLYRGTLHGVPFEDLPRLLALHADRPSYLARIFGEEAVERFADEVLRLMEDGVTSRAEFRRIFADNCDPRTLDAMFSPWGGIFVYLARRGQVAFRSMTSRDFDLISAEPSQTPGEVLPGLIRSYFEVYGPASLADAAWFFGLEREEIQKLRELPLDEFSGFELGGQRYYFCDDGDTADIPELTLLSGFDPLLVSYADRSAVLPAEHKNRVILKSGICNPTIALHGRVAGIWNVQKGEPVVEFFAPQPRRIIAQAAERVDALYRRARLN